MVHKINYKHNIIVPISEVWSAMHKKTCFKLMLCYALQPCKDYCDSNRSTPCPDLNPTPSGPVYKCMCVCMKWQVNLLLSAVYTFAKTLIGAIFYPESLRQGSRGGEKQTAHGLLNRKQRHSTRMKYKT